MTPKQVDRYLTFVNNMFPPTGFNYDRIGYWAQEGAPNVVLVGIVGSCVWTYSSMSVQELNAILPGASPTAAPRTKFPGPRKAT